MLRFRFVCVGAVALIALSGCKRRRESTGEVGQNWSPRPGSAIHSVPVGEVEQAIKARLAAVRPEHVSADHWHHVHTLYQEFGGAPLWFGEDGIDSRRTGALIDALSDGTHDALRFDDMPLSQLQHALGVAKQASQATPQQLADADVILTSAYVALGEDLLTGQVDPKHMSQDWHIDPHDERIDSALVRSLHSDSLAASIAAMKPQDPGYAALRTALDRYREIARRGGWPRVPAGRALKRGDMESASRLAALRARLATEGLVDSAAASSDSAAGARSRYDAALAGAVARFQATHGITVDSVLGAETVKSMNTPAQYRVGQIAANLERYRWLPRKLGDRHIVVNVPAFRLEAYDSGQKVLEMKVVVGAEYENRKTPVFSDNMQYLVFRPYWLVPDSIAAREIWPKVQADPGYLDRDNYEIYNDRGKQRIRQKPGDKNSLGLVKFMFPNDFNIYLHDTPQQQLFQKDVRAFSHGCIRLQKPAELAQWVLGWPPERVQQEMHDGPDNHQVNLPQKIPVYIVYFTVYSRDGELYFGNDLYDRDATLVDAVAAGAIPSAETLQLLRDLRQLINAPAT